MDFQNYYSVEDDILLHDPLSETSRKERKMLLASATMGILVAWSGLVPARVPAFGIEFSLADKVALMRVVAAVISYFLLAFVIYGALDLIRWYLLHRQQLTDFLKKIRLRSLKIRKGNQNGYDVRKADYLDDLIEEESGKGASIVFLVQPVTLMRVIFEFVLPILVGFYGIYAVLSFRPS